MTPEQNPYAAPAEFSKLPAAAADPIPAIQGAQFPLRMSFKFFALAPTVTITDATGRVVLHVRQKLMRLKEQVEVFADTERAQKVAHIAADRIIDWSARYNFTEASGRPVGATGRRGMRSLWRVHYDVFNPGDSTPDFVIREANPVTKLLDGLIGEIPVIGLASAFFFHPQYSASRAGGPEAMRVTKQAAFLEGRFKVERLTDLTDRETLNLLLAFLMLVLLERRRG